MLQTSNEDADLAKVQNKTEHNSSNIKNKENVEHGNGLSAGTSVSPLISYKYFSECSL